MVLSKDEFAIWQERLADQLRRGSVEQVKIEARQGVFHVVGSYRSSQGNVVWDSYAYFSKPTLAEEALRVVKRIASWN